MRKILLIALAAFCFSAKAQDIDVLHYKFQLRLYDDRNEIEGKAEIKLRFLKTITSFTIDLITGGSHTIGMNPIVSGSNLQGQINEKSSIQIRLREPGVVDSIYSFEIIYSGIPADGLIISKNKYGDRTFFADNWPNRAHHWIPCVDRPDDKASFEFIVTAPSHYKVISNGIKLAEKEVGNEMKLTHWREDTPLSTKMMVIGVAKFSTKTYDDSPKDTPVSAWAYPQDSAKWFYDYALAPGILKFFADYIGPFPYKKLANVQSKTVFGGMENASAIFYNEDYVTGSRAFEDVIAHEIAHQWFGDMVSEKSFAHLWLSEGFADYFEHFYFEKKYGEKAAREKWLAARDEVITFARQSNKAVVDSTENLMSLLNANSYKKGAWFLRMLRYEVGDSIFQNIIRTFYNQYKGRNAETRDFETVAERVSGKELTWFFHQWLYRPGIPQLKFAKTKTKDGVGLIVTQLQDSVYNLNLPVLIGQEKKPMTLKLTNRKDFFLIGTDADSAIVIDPTTCLLFQEIK